VIHPSVSKILLSGDSIFETERVVIIDVFVFAAV
jgi:hypothetical protein